MDGWQRVTAATEGLGAFERLFSSSGERKIRTRKPIKKRVKFVTKLPVLFTMMYTTGDVVQYREDTQGVSK